MQEYGSRGRVAQTPCSDERLAYRPSMAVAWLRYLTLMAALALQGCSGQPRGSSDRTREPLAGYRYIGWSDCCRVPSPFDASVTIPGNVIDTEVMEISSPTGSVRLELVGEGQERSAPPFAETKRIKANGQEGSYWRSSNDSTITGNLPLPITDDGTRKSINFYVTCTSGASCSRFIRGVSAIEWIGEAY